MEYIEGSPTENGDEEHVIVQTQTRHVVESNNKTNDNAWQG